MAETNFPVRRTPDRVRRLSAQDLQLPTTFAASDHASNRPDDPPLEADDPRLTEVRDLLSTYGGVIFTGPPGTSKSWYAAKIANALAEGDAGRVRFVQFHPSYQYEDFVQGFVPKKGGEGFELVGKHLLELCAAAADRPDKAVVLVIDELSRGDPGRIFGEALTYVEKTKRGLAFRLASGDEAVIPDNLVFLATMNPLDRGVDEVDAAFERRFAKIAMDPNVSILETFLDDNGVADPLRSRIIGFFRAANKEASANPYTAVGHTFFLDVQSAADVRRLWDHQLRFLFEKAYRLDPDGFNEIARNYAKITDLRPPGGGEPGSDNAAAAAMAEDGPLTDEDQSD